MNNRYHDDGTISYYSLYLRRRIEQAATVPDRELLAMPPRVRARALSHITDGVTDDTVRGLRGEAGEAGDARRDCLDALLAGLDVGEPTRYRADESFDGDGGLYTATELQAPLDHWGVMNRLRWLADGRVVLDTWDPSRGDPVVVAREVPG